MYLKEVEVKDIVLNGVELSFTEDSLVIFAVNFDIDEVDVRSEDKLVSFFL